MSKLRCPKCRTASMHAHPVEGLNLERCDTCRGIYLDEGELLTILERRLGVQADTLQFSAISDAMDAVAAICPHCEQLMPRIETSSGLTVDLCRDCKGVFLDEGELATLQLERG